MVITSKGVRLCVFFEVTGLAPLRYAEPFCFYFPSVSKLPSGHKNKTDPACAGPV